jgi:branched-chain amino acid transport system substrate-binding protein
VGLLLATAGCGAVRAWLAPVPVPVAVIGVDLDLTGPAPGVGYGNGLRLAVELVNTQRLAGGHHIELRMLDNRGDAATSAHNLVTLAADPQVVAIITAGCAQCVIDTAGELAVPVIALAGEEEVAAPADQRRWVFRLGPTAADDADVLSQAMARHGVSTVGVIATVDPYGQEGLRWVRDAAVRDGLEVVATAELDPSAGEVAVAEAARVVASWQPPSDPLVLPAADQPESTGPHAVVIWVPASQATAVAGALRGAGYTGRFFVDMVAADELFLTGTESVWAGATLVFTTTAVADQRIASSPAAAARQEWVLSYVSRYQTYHLHSSFAADALLVIAAAIARGGIISRAGIRDRIESTRLDGITGPIRFTADQHCGLSPAALLTLTATAERWQ